MSLKTKIQAAKATTAPHLVIIARAGTGKTTTLVEGLKLLKGQTPAITPSPQQQAIWDSLLLSPTESSVCFSAFNKSIATELQTRVPDGCTAMTMHSMGLKAVTKTYGRLKINNYRVHNLLEKIIGTPLREVKKQFAMEIQATITLVGLCKVNLLAGTEDDLDYLTSYYDVDTNGSRDKIYSYVPKLLEMCADPEADKEIDFNDMIWLPVHNNLSVEKYDLLLVDEAQDLNKCQQSLAMKVGRRLVLCGDNKQAIYGFAGADSKSIASVSEVLKETKSGLVTLPLTVTRRCGKAIVQQAQKYVPDFEAHESNGDGTTSTGQYESGDKCYTNQVQDGDMVLCRVNAPLVQQCFKFLKEGRKANIQGRDIGRGLISTITKCKAESIQDLVAKLDSWVESETSKELAKKNPSETKLLSINDRYACLIAFIDHQETVQGVIDKINNVFTDDKTGGVLLSSVHKAKGLEAERVFLLQPKGATIPHPMAKSEWQVDQEYNILYVAITRAIKELVYVS